EGERARVPDVSRDPGKHRVEHEDADGMAVQVSAAARFHDGLPAPTGAPERPAAGLLFADQATFPSGGRRGDAAPRRSRTTSASTDRRPRSRTTPKRVNHHATPAPVCTSSTPWCGRPVRTVACSRDWADQIAPAGAPITAGAGNRSPG